MFKVKVALTLLVILLSMPILQIGSDAVNDGIISAPISQKVDILKDNADYGKASLKVVATSIKGVNSVLEDMLANEAKNANDNIWRLMGQAFGVGGSDLNSVVDNMIGKL